MLARVNSFFTTKTGSSCSTAVEHTPRNLVVMGSYPAGCLSLFLLWKSMKYTGHVSGVL